MNETLQFIIFHALCTSIIYIFLTNFPKAEVIQFVFLYIFFFNFCLLIFFRRMLRFWFFFSFFFFAGKVSASWWSRSKNFLNQHLVNLSVCLFNILFGCNFRKNRTRAKKFWFVFELHIGLHYIWKILLYRS